MSLKLLAPQPPDRGSTTTLEVVDWGRAGEANLMVTLNALRVLASAGRVTVGP